MLQTKTKALQLGLDQVQTNINNSKDLLSQAQDLIVNRSTWAFEQERNPVNAQPWPQLKIPRLGKMLHKSGALQSSLKIAWENDRLSIGYTSAYAALHQLGSKQVSARPFLGISPELWQQLRQSVSKACLQGL